MNTLALLRHGQSIWNRQRRFTGWTDVDLSPEGREEAAERDRVLAHLDLARVPRTTEKSALLSRLTELWTLTSFPGLRPPLKRDLDVTPAEAALDRRASERPLGVVVCRRCVAA